MNTNTISREMAIDSIRYAGKIGKLTCIDILKKLPSVEIGITHCKDCKHYQFADNRAFGVSVKRCEWSGLEDIDDDDFCSHAERKTE